MAIKVGVVGAAGYAGVELVRLLISHPDFELTAITSNADAGQSLASVYPAFAGVCDLAFTNTLTTSYYDTIFITGFIQ